LAALHRRENDEAAVQNYLVEAKQLDPKMADAGSDLVAFAAAKGIELPSSLPIDAYSSNPEVDLSPDLLDIFFSEANKSTDATEEQSEPSIVDDLMAAPFMQEMSSQVSEKSIEEQLQEVDFYIRLGFKDEALAKLNELAKLHPKNPELAARYEKLGEVEASAEPIPITAVAEEAQDELKVSDNLFDEFLNAAPAAEGNYFSEQNVRCALDQFPSVEGPEPLVVEKEIHDQIPIEEFPTGFAFALPTPDPKPEPEPQPGKLEEGLTAYVNDMFADIMEETDAMADKEAAKESFEDHFSLGTAYRDMDLAEEAIREFENALKVAERQKDNEKIIQCCGMLSTSFLKKGMARSALKWCQKGLSVADISSHEAMALRYDMGMAHSISGAKQRALECFDEVFGLDPDYRDVAQKIDEIKGGFERHAP